MNRKRNGIAGSWRLMVLVWLPLAVLYPIAVMMLYPEPFSIQSILRSLGTISLAVLLAASGWWITGKLPWPERPGAGFYLSHVAVGLGYAATWWGAAGAFRAVLAGTPALEGVRDAIGSIYLPWNLLFGLLIYGLCVGLSYAVRTQELVRQERLNAANATALATRANLAALQAQLNPHFLFNVLHTLSALVRRDPATAEDALERLGDIMRYALDQADREQVLLREEWAFVEDYLAIERLRLGERLVLECDVDPDALDRPVPPFCLQPLVENAIRHAVSPQPAGGHIRIVVRGEADRTVMEVTDDGPGATAAALAESTGFGLRALSRRLSALPAPGGRLDFENREGGGLRAVIVLSGNGAGARPARARVSS